MGHPSDAAIMLSDCGDIKNILSYEQIYEIRNLITEFILKHVTEQHQCIGLRMIHNIYIPPIVLSLQDLQHAFIFLPIEEADIIIEELGILWVLSFRTEKCVATLSLNDHNLALAKCVHDHVTIYKDISYIIRTSGTTGQNKFVKVGKYSIESNIKCLSKIFNIKNTDRIYFGTPLTFDPSMIELLLALHSGACLLITSPNIHMNPLKLHETLFHPQNGVTVLQIVPSLFLRWSQDQIRSILLNKNLRILAFGGECFPQSLLCFKRTDSLRIFNLYGITEVSCWAMIHEVSEEKMEDNVALGDALEDTVIEIRDNFGHKLTEGEGEVYIGSTNRICWVDNEPNVDQLATFRASGDIAVINNKGIFYKGRKNDVFKRLGHKLHLSEIEEMIKTETGLENKCVWSTFESKLLVFLLIENFDVSMKDKVLDKVRVKLLHTLPKQYFPDYIDIIRKCPVTSHGKTNKSILESIYLNRNPTDKINAVDILKSLLCKYFGLDEKQLMGELQKTTFFEMGGNSILAVQFLNDFKEETGTDCPDLVTAVFENDLKACFKCVQLLKVAKKRSRISKIDQNTVKKIKGDVELKIAWTYNLQACVDSSAIVFEHGGKLLVGIGSFSHIFAVLDAITGTEKAKFVLPDAIEGTPCLSPCHNFLYVGCFDGCLYCLDFIGNTIKWVYPTADRIKCKPVLCQQSTAVVFGSYDKYVHCVNSLNGSIIWKTHVNEGVVSTPLVQKTKIYIATICGTCLCLLETTGEILWKYKSGSPIFGAPCALDGIIMWPNVHGTILTMTTSGQKVQQYECGGYVYSSLVTYKNLVIFGCHNHNLYILEVENGVLKTKAVVDLDDVLTTPCICRDQVVVASNCGRLLLVDFEGRLHADLRLPGEVFSSVTAHDRRLFLGCRDNNFYCIEIN